MKKQFYRQYALMLSFLTAMVLAAADAPWWVSFFAVFILVWKWAAEKNNVRLLPKKVTAALSVLLAVQVYFQYGTLLGQEPSNTLLVGLAALKIMDYENGRDHKFLIMLGFILVSLKAIFSIDFYWLIPSLLVFAGLWYSLLSEDFRAKGSFLARLFILSIPATVILFFAFPRIVVPWALARSNNMNNVVGFSDQLNPGGVAELASVDMMAFRAKFVDTPMSAPKLYWRGSVLNLSEGLRWRLRRPKPDVTKVQLSEKLLGYDIILEPGSKGYLFTLNQAQKVTAESFPVNHYQHGVFRTVQPANKALSYHAESDLAGKDENVPSEEFLQTPSLTPGILALVEKIKKENKSEKSRLIALENYFKDPRFVYTLKPGAYLKNELESFLLERKQGFCEHFAGAYATLARALNIPARVVVGYQGGTYNPYGDFWRVSQRDAHAWAEIFTEGRWQLMDPTAWVAPLRLTLGANEFFNLSEEQQRILARDTQWQGVHPETRWQDAVAFWFEDLNYRWTYWLLDFDAESQRGFWIRISQNLGYFFAGALVLAIAYLLVLRKTLRGGLRRSAVEKLLDRTIRWGEKRGVAYDPAFSPLNYLQTLQKKFPEQSAIIGQIADLYDQENYRGQSVGRERLRDIKL